MKECLAALISWIDPSNASAQPVSIPVGDCAKAGPLWTLAISWSLPALENSFQGLTQDVDRFRQGRTPLIEDHVKLAAYGLAFVAISILLHERVLQMNIWNPPDLLLDITPGQERGVEVAGRSRGGRGKLVAVVEGVRKMRAHGRARKAAKGNRSKPGKRQQILALRQVSEAFVSLWCNTPLVSVWERVKP